MQLSKFIRVVVLFLSIAVTSKASFGAVLTFANRSGHLHTIAVTSTKPRERYDDRHERITIKAPAYHFWVIPSTLQFSNPEKALALEARLTERDLLNIHYRILPERKVFLLLRKITV